MTAQLLSKYQSYTYPPGKQLFTESHYPQGVYFIESGMVKMAVKGNQIVQLAGAGEWVGLDYLFSDTPYQQSAIAMEQSKVVFLPLEDLKEELRQSMSLLKTIFQNINKRLEEVQEWGTLLVQQKTELRVVHALLLIKEKFGVDQKNFLHLQLSPKNLAYLASTTRTTVYRILSRLKRANVIRSEGDKISLLREDILQNMHQYRYD